MNISNLKDSNCKISELINGNKPFSLVRLGIGSETFITYEYIQTNQLNVKYLHPQLFTLYNAGIYTNDKDLSKIILYCSYYNNAIKEANLLASFDYKLMYKEQNFFSQKYNLPQIHSRSLEPFYVLMEGEIPWTHHLKGKKVLIINPFVDSFQKQLANKFQIFKDKKLFLDDQEFVFYKSYQTIAGNHIHKNWLETFTIMCKDIEKLDFDVALLGCGGYGLPLCNFIKTKLNKSAIYVGGGLQLLFGVMGRRWENNEMWRKIIYENNSKFIRPSADENCSNNYTIEGGCYW